MVWDVVVDSRTKKEEKERTKKEEQGIYILVQQRRQGKRIWVGHVSY